MHELAVSWICMSSMWLWNAKKVLSAALQCLRYRGILQWKVDGGLPPEGIEFIKAQVVVQLPRYIQAFQLWTFQAGARKLYLLHPMAETPCKRETWRITSPEDLGHYSNHVEVRWCLQARLWPIAEAFGGELPWSDLFQIEDDWAAVNSVFWLSLIKEQDCCWSQLKDRSQDKIFELLPWLRSPRHWVQVMFQNLHQQFPIQLPLHDLHSANRCIMQSRHNHVQC